MTPCIRRMGKTDTAFESMSEAAVAAGATPEHMDTSETLDPSGTKRKTLHDGTLEDALLQQRLKALQA